MNFLLRRFGIPLACLVASGCVTGPALDIVSRPDRDSDVVTILKEIACEIASSDTLVQNHYVVTASLVLKADNAAGITPSLSFIHPLHHAPSTSQSTGVGGEISRTISRQYSQSFQIFAAKVVKSEVCGDVHFDATTGPLGLGDIVTAAFDTRDTAIHGVSRLAASPSAPAVLIPNDVPAFGSTIIFTYKRAASASPTWTLVHFHGPTNSGTFLSTGRTDTNTLTLAFAPTDVHRLTSQSQQERDAAEAAASIASYALLQQLILQNATLGRP